WADFDNKVPQADVLKKEESPKEESKEDKATSYSPRDKTVPVERHLSGATRGNSVTTQVVIASAREAVLRVQTQFDWAWGLVGVLSLTVMVLLIIIFI
ncbi:hypothetical protein KAI87_10185, partial [Myxococcota bacterium]|nr:hypothetical protein [Myxococcota bacterium]